MPGDQHIGECEETQELFVLDRLAGTVFEEKIALSFIDVDRQATEAIAPPMLR